MENKMQVFSHETFCLHGSVRMDILCLAETVIIALLNQQLKKNCS